MAPGGGVVQVDRLNVPVRLIIGFLLAIAPPRRDSLISRSGVGCHAWCP